MKKLDLLSVCFLGINVIVGAGIFLLPRNVFLSLGYYSIIVLLIVMLLAIGLGLVFAEMASRYQEDGSSYIYVKDNFGEYAGFMIAFTRFVAAFMLWAAMATGFSEALKIFFPIFENKVYSISASIGLTIILGCLNLRGLSIAKFMNNLFTIAKIIPLLVFVVLGIFFIDVQRLFILPDFNAPLIETFSLSQGILLIFFAFAGIEDVALLTSNIKNSSKNTPKAIIIILIFVSILYFLIFLISQGVLGSTIATSQNPIQDVLTQILGKTGKIIASVGILVALIGSNISIAFLYSRKLVALAESRALPSFIKSTNSHGVPHYSVIITMIITCCAIFINKFSLLAEIVIITLMFQYILVMFATLKSRKRGIPSTVKAPFLKTVTTLCTLLFFVSIIDMGISKFFFGLLIWIILGSIMYLFIPKKK